MKLIKNRRASTSRRKSDRELREAAQNFLNWYLGAVGIHRTQQLLDPSNRDGEDVRRLHNALKFAE